MRSKKLNHSRTFGAFALLITAIPVVASAQSIFVRRDTVIPVLFDNSLTLSESHEGDRFSAHVFSNRYLPLGTSFSGLILRIRPADGNHPGSMQLQFDQMILPSGRAVSIDAVPVPRNGRGDRDGDVGSQVNSGREAADIVGGAVGGLAIGSIFHRSAVGLLGGTVAGMFVASADHEHSANIIIERGQRVGLLLNDDLVVRSARYTNSQAISGRGKGSWARPTDVASTGGSQGRSTGTWGDKIGPSTAPIAPALPVLPEVRPAIDPPTERDTHFDRDVSLRLNDTTLTFDADHRPYYEGNTVMVAVSSMAKQLGFGIVTGRDNTVYVESDDSSLKLTQDSSLYRVNGVRGSLPTAVVNRNGELYAPVSVFAEIAHGALYINGAKIRAHKDQSTTTSP